MVMINGDYTGNGADKDYLDRGYSDRIPDTPGKAYGFFKRSEIGPEIPEIRRVIGTPSDLDITPIKDIYRIKDRGLRSIAIDAMRRGIHNVLEVTSRGTNKGTEGETAAIFNQASQYILEPDETFRGAVVSQNKVGEYIFRN